MKLEFCWVTEKDGYKRDNAEHQFDSFEDLLTDNGDLSVHFEFGAWVHEQNKIFSEFAESEVFSEGSVEFDVRVWLIEELLLKVNADFVVLAVEDFYHCNGIENEGDHFHDENEVD